VTTSHASEPPVGTASPVAMMAVEEPGTMPTGSEPEPVVTETMAEVYAKQGLMDQARAVYLQLIAQRPNDEKLRRRLAELSPRESGQRRRRQSAAMTGGISARAFVAAVLTGRPMAVPPPPPPDATPLESAYAEATPTAQPAATGAGAGGFS